MVSRLLWVAGATGLLLFAVSSVQAAERGFEFEVGETAGRGPVAIVAVEQLVQPEKKGRFFRAKEIAPVAMGVAVRFQELEVAALDEIPPTVQARTNAQKVQMRRVALYAPGDPVPRLMAEEALVLAKGEWALKKVLLADRPSAPECRLIWGNGTEPRLAFLRSKKTLPLSELLASRDAP